MTLTAEQLERRTRGVGGSEVAAVIGLDLPQSFQTRTPLDVWIRKRRGPNLEIAPLVPPDIEPDPDKPAVYGSLKLDRRTAGHIAEEYIAQLYQVTLGVARVEKSGTRQHADEPWSLATPDRFAWLPPLDERAPDRGFEGKAVGSTMTDEWPEGGLPPYVFVQVQWCMYVTGLRFWDVGALVGGPTNFRVVPVVRDDELIADMAERVREFWHRHVLGDEAPEPSGPADLKRAVLARWRQDNGEEVKAPPEAASLVAAFLEAQARAEGTEDAVENARAALIALCGPNKAMTGPWGKFHFGTTRGQVDWKAVAEELSGGVVPLDVCERHRRDPHRTPRLYPFKAKK